MNFHNDCCKFHYSLDIWTLHNDETHFTLFETSFQVEEQIELSLGKITSWFADNSLVSNVKKTNLMKFQQRPPNSKDTLTVSVDMCNQLYLKKINFLGLHVDWQLAYWM